MRAVIPFFFLKGYRFDIPSCSDYSSDMLSRHVPFVRMIIRSQLLCCILQFKAQDSATEREYIANLDDYFYDNKTHVHP